MSKFAFLRRGGLYLLPLSILVLAVAMRIAAPGLLDRGALIAFDLYQRAAPRETGNLPIRIVDIDEASLKELGQWPWPRGIIAKLIDRLREAGASVIGFDIDFAEPDRTSPRMLVPLLAQNGLPAEEIGRLLASVPDPDDKLAATMRTVPVVTGFILDDRGGDRAPAAKAGFAFIGDDPLSRVPRFSAGDPEPPRVRGCRGRKRISQSASRLGQRGPARPARLEARRQTISVASRRNASDCGRSARFMSAAAPAPRPRRVSARIPG